MIVPSINTENSSIDDEPESHQWEIFRERGMYNFFPLKSFQSVVTIVVFKVVSNAGVTSSMRFASPRQRLPEVAEVTTRKKKL